MSNANTDSLANQNYKTIIIKGGWGTGRAQGVDRELSAHLLGREGIDNGEALTPRRSNASLLFPDLEVNTKISEQKEVKVLLACRCITSCPMTRQLRTILAVSAALWSGSGAASLGASGSGSLVRRWSPAIQAVRGSDAISRSSVLLH